MFNKIKKDIKWIFRNKVSVFVSSCIIVIVASIGIYFTTQVSASMPYLSILPSLGKLALQASIKQNSNTTNYVQFGVPVLSPSIMWGIGDEIGGAVNTPIYQNAKMDFVTAWYNGPGDLNWMNGYNSHSNTAVSNIYQQHKAIELVVWLANGTDPRSASQSSTAGQPLPEYALSSQFLTDLTELVNMYKGHGPYYGPLYVVLYTEFNGTYGYNWPGSPYTNRTQYNAALMNQYIKAVNLIHSDYSQAKVGLGFGGYAWYNGGAVDLTPYQQAINASDFTAVQAMQSCTNESLMAPQIEASVKQLGAYKPVMISHFKLWDDSTNPSATQQQKAACATSSFANFEQTMFNSSTLAQLKSEGLFAWDFMSDDYINDPGPQYNTAVNFINKHSAASLQIP